MRRIFIFLILFVFSLNSIGARITGTVSDRNGNKLAFASVTVQGTSKGAITNSQGAYSIILEPGSYILVCQYVGYHSEEKKIMVGTEDQRLNFTLSIQELKMEEVVIRRGEDPALEIIRQTIRKRKFYNDQVDSFTVDVYIKGLLRSRSMPERFMGQKIDRKEMSKEGIDSEGKGILFLSESLTRVSFSKPYKIKYDVLSSRQSGGGYGLSLPFFVNFYVNNVSVSNTNPRGFISPIADNAFHYYKFHYEGNFFEGKKMIDRIKVTPKRKNEPLFEGYIQIIDGEWRIHSLDLITSSAYGLELIDTLRLTQIHAPINAEVWRAQNQVVYVSLNKFGFDLAGNFLNVYSNYNLTPGFGRKYFNRILMAYDSGSIKKDSSYWASVRPVPLEPDERRDFVFKDSVHQIEKDSFSKLNIDSLRKHEKPVQVKEFFIGGVNRNYYHSRSFVTYHFRPLLTAVQYNTVEGLVLSIGQSVDIRPKKGTANFYIHSNTRYGFSNQHLNPFLAFSIRPKGDNFRDRYLSFAGGKRVSQFNNDNPIDPLANSIYTLFYKRNYMKLYENRFGSVEYNNRFENGIRWKINTTYEDRLPLENTTDFSFYKKTERSFLPNHPYELADIPFNRHQALLLSIVASFQPGQRYIQLPHEKIPLGSKYPTLELAYTKGIRNLLSSDVDYDKWKFSVYDDANLKIGGLFRYRFSAGGFLSHKALGIPDYQHFNGNQTYHSVSYLNSFQLAPYYRYSNTEKIFAELHAEHHFNGLLTNKIPLFNKLKWYLVAGSNTFYVNRRNYYVEAFAGLENIFKIFRVDFITAYQTEPGHYFAIRLGAGGIIGGLIPQGK